MSDEIIKLHPHQLPARRAKPAKVIGTKGRPVVLGADADGIVCLPPSPGYSATQRRQDFALKGQDDSVQMAVALLMSNSLYIGHGLSPIPPRGETMKAIAGNPEAEALAEETGGRHLFSPAALRTKALLSYCNRLAPLAFRVSKEPVSLHMARPLTNAANWRQVQEVMEQVMELYQVENADPLPEDTLVDITALTGFTVRMAHPTRGTVSVDRCNREPGEGPEAYAERLQGRDFKIVQNHNGNYNEGQRWIKDTVPDGEGFAEWLLRTNDVYGSAMFRRVENQKVNTIREAHLAFIQEMTPLARQRMEDYWYRTHPHTPFHLAFEYTAQDFQRAVNAVFREKWSALDVTGQPGGLERDKEVVLARSLLARLARASNLGWAKPRYLPGAYFLALALITGVPITSWVRFAIEDLGRRGEGFIRAQMFDELIEAIELSELTVYMTGELREELEELRWELDQVGRDADGQWAAVLRKGRHLLWTRGFSPYHEELDADGEVRYTVKADRRLAYA